jgi:hypothetical protein
MKNANVPYWYRLITSLKSQKEITNGLTIPYIIGANKLIDDSLVIDSSSIKQLLNELINSSMELVSVIQKCDNKQYIIGLKDKKYCEKYFSHEIFFTNSNGEKTLYLTLNAQNIGTTINEINETFINLYSKCLLEQNFSWDNNDYIWRPFNAHEKEQILNLL